jgi:diguanylate cyclase (GGDEF)-like protein
MSDTSRVRKIHEEDGLDLTRTIRKLSIGDAMAMGTSEDLAATALLFSANADAIKWVPRWLGQNDIGTAVISGPVDGLDRARSAMPQAIIVDAAFAGQSGRPLYQELLDAQDLETPVFVMCHNAREVNKALELEPYDVIRKPFEWKLVGHRIRRAIDTRRLETQLSDRQDSLDAALAVADAARQRLRRGESIDGVTGLPNKRKLIDLVRRSMRSVDNTDAALAVIVVGFNRFRLVIEAMGQEQADMILAELGRILTDCMGEFDPVPADTTQRLRTTVVATLDHFRFAIMLTTPRGSEDLGALQQLLQERLAQPIRIAGQTVSLSSCQGVAFYPHDAEDVDSLLQRADNAMRDAQSRGGGFKYYCTETDAAAARKLKIEHMLHEALDREELSLAFQPITRVKKGVVVAAEALLRWQQPDGSFISPSEFVPVAEESGLMNRIGECVLDSACKQLSEWHAADINLPHICVNVAKSQLMSGDFVPTVKRILAKYDVEPAALELELSERGVLSGDFDVLKQLQELKGLGVRLSIDDFGTGDSAIAYLRELPIDVLKIDRSYIAGMTDNAKDAALVSAMVAIGQRLDLMVVAEGVETPEQLAALSELHCDAFQGFLLSQPVPARDFLALLKKP